MKLKIPSTKRIIEERLAQQLALTEANDWLEKCFQSFPSFNQKMAFFGRWLGLKVNYDSVGLNSDQFAIIQGNIQYWLDKINKHQIQLNNFTSELTQVRSRLEKNLFICLKVMLPEDREICARRLRKYICAANPFTAPDPQRERDIKNMLTPKRVRFSTVIERAPSQEVKRQLDYSDSTDNSEPKARGISVVFTHMRAFLTRICGAPPQAAGNENIPPAFAQPQPALTSSSAPILANPKALTFHTWHQSGSRGRFVNSVLLEQQKRVQPARRCKNPHLKYF